MRELFRQFNLDIQSVTGTDHLSELCIVLPCHDWDFSVFDNSRSRDQDCSRLKGRLALKDARQHGEVWVMSLEDRQVGIDELACTDPSFRNLDDFIDPKKGISMRDQVLNFFAVQVGLGL